MNVDGVNSGPTQSSESARVEERDAFVNYIVNDLKGLGKAKKMRRT